MRLFHATLGSALRLSCPPARILWLSIALLMAVPLTLTSCSGGGDGGNGNSTPVNPAFITITDPDPSTQATNCDEIFFAGKAFISPTHSACCTGQPSDSGVTVRWTNQTSGQSGAAIQRVLEGLGIVMEDSWSANVPLVLGSNVIAVTASDPEGHEATKTTTVSKPNVSYSISGTLRTNSGTPVSARSSDITFSLSTDPASGPSVTPLYRFSCLLNGTYTVTPRSGAFPFVFSPPSQTLTIAGSDVANIDFQVDASMLSGAITFSSSGNGVSAFVNIAGSVGSFTTFTSDSGAYHIAVPNGAFTITPSDGPLTFTPSSRSVVVSNADMTGLDFVSP
jgi:hypothetical protein